MCQGVESHTLSPPSPIHELGISIFPLESRSWEQELGGERSQPREEAGLEKSPGCLRMGEVELEPVGEEVEKRRLAPAKGVMSGCQAAENGRRGHMKTSTRGCKVGEPGGPLPAL